VLQVRHATLVRPQIQQAVIAGFEAILSALAAHDSVTAHDAMMQFVLAAERDYATLSETGADDARPRGDDSRVAD
jgi:DNA-binding FadR family transcriptional regulator